jgi:hypothetical protein
MGAPVKAMGPVAGGTAVAGGVVGVVGVVGDVGDVGDVTGATVKSSHALTGEAT